MRNWNKPDYFHLGPAAEQVLSEHLARQAEEERLLRNRQEAIAE